MGQIIMKIMTITLINVFADTTFIEALEPFECRNLFYRFFSKSNIQIFFDIHVNSYKNKNNMFIYN